MDSIEYENNDWDNQRHEILILYRDREKNSKNYTKGIDLCYRLIEKNREKLSKISANTIKSLKTMINNIKDKDRENTYLFKNSINLYKCYEDCICNILLLINGFLLSKRIFYNV